MLDQFEWFDNELRAVFGVDAFGEPFDQDQGFQFYGADGVRVCVIRFEDVHAAFEPAMHALLGASRLDLPRVNDGQRKYYARSTTTSKSRAI